jgi:hypothetical protein
MLAFWPMMDFRRHPDQPGHFLPTNEANLHGFPTVGWLTREIEEDPSGSNRERGGVVLILLEVGRMEGVPWMFSEERGWEVDVDCMVILDEASISKSST